MKWIKNFYQLISFSFIIAMILASCNTHPKSPGDNALSTATGHNFTDTSSSSVNVFDQNGRVCIQQSNTYYDVVNAYHNGTQIPLLLKIKKTELCYADSLNKDKVFEISARSLMDTKAINWDAKFVATDVQYKDNTLLAVHESPDNEEDFLRRFSLLDGKEVFSCSYGELKVSIPNVKDKRFIGFTSRKAVSQPIQALNDENLIGLIRYGSSTQAGNIFRVKLKRSKVAAKIPTSTPDMVLVPADASTTAIDDGKNLILMKADEHYQPSDVTNFSVKMTFYYGDDNETTTISIPVVNDKLDLSQAKYDKDIFDITDF
jgi:hypothetical protein